MKTLLTSLFVLLCLTFDAVAQAPPILRQVLTTNLVPLTVTGGVESQGAIGGTGVVLQLSVPANHQNGVSYTVQASDRNKFIVCSNAAAFALTVPQAGTSAFTNGFNFYVKNLGAGLVTITPTGCNIDGLASINVAQYGGVRIATGGTNYYAISRAISPVIINASTGSSYTTDASQAVNLTVRLLCTTNFTLANPTGGTDGQSVLWEFQQDSTNGQHAITLGNGFGFGSDVTAVVLTTNVNKRDFMSARYNASSNLWYVLSFARGY